MPTFDATQAEVSLHEITAATVRAVTNLRVAPEQDGYVAHNAVSIAQAYFQREEAWFRAIHAADVLIGFVMLRDATLLTSVPENPQLSLWRFMIDHRYQRLGFGRKALKLIVSHASTRPGIKSLQTTYVVGPDGPKDFYLSFGFKHTGEIKPSGEVVIVLELHSS